MKNRITHTRKVLGLAVVALSAASVLWGGGWLRPVAASGGDGSIRFVRPTITGIVPGQMLGISVANLATPSGSPITWEYKVVSTDGALLYESERTRVPAGGSAGEDLLIGGFTGYGEPRTGRVQMLVKVIIEAPASSKTTDCPVSLEIIDEETGATSAVVPTGSVTFHVDGL